MTIRLAALPELTAAIAQLEQRAAAEGIRFTTADFGGTRTQADTTQILGYRDAEYAIYADHERQAGRTPLPINSWRPIQPYGSSFHNYGAARDVIITGKPATMTSTDAMDRLAQLAATVGLRRPLPTTDPGHLELAITLNDARARWGNYIDGADDDDSASPAGGASSLAIGLVIGVGLLLIFARGHGA